MSNRITIIDFNISKDKIENLADLPPAALEVFNAAESIMVKGFQEILGHIGRQMIWSCGGYWTGRHPQGKFHITSMGNGSQLFVE